MIDHYHYDGDHDHDRGEVGTIHLEGKPGQHINDGGLWQICGRDVEFLKLKSTIEEGDGDYDGECDDDGHDYDNDGE